MKHVKLSLIDTDQAVQAKADLNMDDTEDMKFSRFVEQIKEELVTGQTAFLEIEGLLNKPVVISLAESI